MVGIEAKHSVRLVVALELNPDDIGLSGDRLGCDGADRAPALAGRLRFQIFATFADYDVALVRPYLVQGDDARDKVKFTGLTQNSQDDPAV